jgi:hypothetical protein
MLLGLRWCLERHPGEKRLVAWARRKTANPREQEYGRLLRPEALFREGLDSIDEGKPFDLRTCGGQAWAGLVEFVRAGRGFCLSVRELNQALLWVTIEGAGEALLAQIWLSAFGLPERTSRDSVSSGNNALVRSWTRRDA